MKRRPLSLELTFIVYRWYRCQREVELKYYLAATPTFVNANDTETDVNERKWILKATVLKKLPDNDGKLTITGSRFHISYLRYTHFIGGRKVDKNCDSYDLQLQSALYVFVKGGLELKINPEDSMNLKQKLEVQCLVED